MKRYLEPAAAAQDARAHSTASRETTVVMTEDDPTYGKVYIVGIFAPGAGMHSVRDINSAAFRGFLQ